MDTENVGSCLVLRGSAGESHTNMRTLLGAMDTFIILIVVIVSLVYAGQNDQIMHFQSVHFLKM